MKVITLFVTITVLNFNNFVWAADAAKGAKLYASCVSCHGQNGAGSVAQKAPRLAGQYDWYIVTSLNDYKKGARLHPNMKALSSQDMQDLAAHISRLK